MDKHIERVENLIRVVSKVHDDSFNLWSWCDCAIGHAMQDSYFISEGMAALLEPGIRSGCALGDVGRFLDIPLSRATAIFVPNLVSGYGSRKHVLAALRVLLLEKMAQEIAPVLTFPGANDEAQHEEWGGLTKLPVEESANA